MVAGGKNHGKNWLVGRKGKIVETSSTPAPPDQIPIEELTTKIKQDLEANFEARMKQMMQENNARLLKRLGEANPQLNLNVEDFCATQSSDQDETGTPLTQGGTDL